ncbi:MAG: trigger factor [Deltaproteobacteria bacterium]|nr:trigger factor [Deltaproteobacteria bacterium]
MQSENALADGSPSGVKQVDQLSNTRIRLTIEVSPEQVEQHERETTRKYVHAARIPGFRPGKAPINLVRQKYAGEIKRDLVSHLLEHSLTEALKEKNLSPISRPKIEFKGTPLAEGSPFAYEAEFEVEPELTLKNYQAIPLNSVPIEVTEDEVTKTLAQIRERLAVIEPAAETKPEKGLIASIEAGYTLLSDLSKREPAKMFSVEVGSGVLLPELEAGVMDMQVGEKRRIEATFPSDYREKELAGQRAVFDCHLVELKKKTMPELNDTLASELNKGETLEDLKNRIKEEIRASKEAQIRRQHQNKAVEFLIDQNPFEAPSSLVEAQSQKLEQWLTDERSKQGQPSEALTQEEVQSLRKRAEYLVKSSLILKQIAVLENLSVDDKKYKERVQTIATQLNRTVDETEKLLSGRGVSEQLRDEILTDQVFDFLIKHAKFT